MTVFAASLGALIAASYSTFCKFVVSNLLHNQVTFYLTADGRRPAYLCALPILVIGSAGVASAQSIPSLLFWRFFQAMGASPGPALGAGVIGDIFKLEERGRAMGVFFSVSLLFLSMTLTSLTLFQFIRPACLEQLSLLLLEVHSYFFYFCFRNGWVHQTYINNGCSGWVTHYCSWRAMHGILGFLGLVAFTTIYFLFPETSQPGARGIDKMKAEHGTHSSRSFVFINPLQSLLLLRSPTMLLIVRSYTMRRGNKSTDSIKKSIIVFASMVSGFCEVLHQN